jgi:hypothetical protein
VSGRGGAAAAEGEHQVCKGESGVHNVVIGGQGAKGSGGGTSVRSMRRMGVSKRTRWARGRAAPASAASAFAIAASQDVSGASFGLVGAAAEGSGDSSECGSGGAVGVSSSVTGGSGSEGVGCPMSLQ